MKKHYLAFIVCILLANLFIYCSKEDDYVQVPPVAADDTVNSTLMEPVEIHVLDNDVSGGTVVPTTVSIIQGVDTDANGTLNQKIVANEGTWTVNATTGVITFTPLNTFVGNPTQITYTVKDSGNTISNEAHVTINAIPIVTADLTQVPYPKLSDYHFFVGDLKNQIPSLNVLPYEPASSLFSDYAHKKRFVWMPMGTKGTYVADDKIFDLPVGAALIKTFYYDNVQNITPVGATRIIETRIMIRKSTGWIFADYVWNDAQTEAILDLAGSYTNISWKGDDNVIKSTNYRIPTEVQCIICHKSKTMVGTTEVDTYIPIGIKPQNLNFNHTYGTETKNQLTKWIEKGYLDNFTFPSEENTVINYNDASKPIELRVRSYLDSNCAHCHAIDRHCDYRPMRFPFSETGGVNGRTNMGVCVNTEDYSFAPAMTKIIKPGNVNRSMLYYRLNTTDESFRMPLHGRSVIHEEGVALIQEWITNSLPPCQ